jgi:hypothetical protein
MSCRLSLNANPGQLGAVADFQPARQYGVQSGVSRQISLYLNNRIWIVLQDFVFPSAQTPSSMCFGENKFVFPTRAILFTRGGGKDIVEKREHH